MNYRMIHLFRKCPLLLFAILLATPLFGNIIVQKSFESLVKGSTLIVIARPTSASPETVEITEPSSSQTILYKKYQLSIEESLKGRPLADATTVTLLVYDGFKGNTGPVKIVIGAPVPPSDPAVYFLAPFEKVPGTYTLSYYNRSIAPLRLRAGEETRMVLVRPLASSLKRDLSVDDFKKEIKWIIQ